MTSTAMPSPLFKFTTKNRKDFPDTILPISVEKKKMSIAYDLWIALPTLSLDVCQQFISRLRVVVVAYVVLSQCRTCRVLPHCYCGIFTGLSTETD